MKFDGFPDIFPLAGSKGLRSFIQTDIWMDETAGDIAAGMTEQLIEKPFRYFPYSSGGPSPGQQGGNSANLELSGTIFNMRKHPTEKEDHVKFSGNKFDVKAPL